MIQRHFPRGEHHQQMIKHIRRLGCQAVTVALDGFDDRLDRLFTEFLGTFLGAACQKFRGPGGIGIGALAGGDGGGEAVESGHVSLTGMPAAAMWALA